MTIIKHVLVMPFLALPFVATAAGIEVSPARLELQTTAGVPTSTILHVANPAADVQLFSVYADDFTDNLKMRPASFTLEAGDRQDVAVNFIPLEIIPHRSAARVTAWNHSRGDRNTPREFLTGFISPTGQSRQLQTSISVVAKPLSDDAFRANTGTKIPITIVVSPAQTQPQIFSTIPIEYIYIAVGVVLTITLFFYLRRVRARKFVTTK